jgi:hypothetical protein
VTDQSGTTVYQENEDYFINFGDRSTPTNITRVQGGSISDGETVLVSYAIGRALEHNTIDGGGFRVQINGGQGYWFYPVSVVEDDFYPLQTVISSDEVKTGAGKAYIGSDRRIILSTINGDDPSNHSYTVTYLVFNDTGAKDIEATSLEYIRLGSLITNIVG